MADQTLIDCEKLDTYDEAGSTATATSFLRMNHGVKGALYRIENT